MKSTFTQSNLQSNLALNELPQVLRNFPFTHYRPAMPFGNRKKYFRGSFQFSIVMILKIYHSSGTLKYNHFGIFESLKFCVIMEKNPSDFTSAKCHSKYFGLLWVELTEPHFAALLC